MYMTTLPIADARAQLSKLVDEASSTHERFEITKNGHRAAVLMGADDYDAMRETIAVLSDPALLLEHQVGAQAIVEGDVLNGDQLAEVMRNAGRSVDTK
ncbi:MAG: type II toxin-antitoxin system Phd/YefM family antitoxin [Acidimicrobiales bacterium]